MRTSVKVVIGILVGLFLIGGIYLIMQNIFETTSDELENISSEPTGASFENMVKEKLVSQREKPLENVRMNFYNETENENIFAVGAYISPDTSLAFTFDNKTGKIKSYKIDYTAPSQKLKAFKIAADTLSAVRNSYIVPYNFSNTDDNLHFTFEYYEKYNGALSRWMGGSAIVNVENHNVGWLSSKW